MTTMARSITSSTPVEARGVVYPSGRAAASALGIAPCVVSYHLRTHGNLDRVGAKNGPKIGSENGNKPTEIGPHKFKSRKQAADFLGVRIGAVINYARGTATQYEREMVIGAAMATPATSQQYNKGRTQ